MLCATFRLPAGDISWFRKPSATRLNRMADATVGLEGALVATRHCATVRRVTAASDALQLHFR